MRRSSAIPCAIHVLMGSAPDVTTHTSLCMARVQSIFPVVIRMAAPMTTASTNMQQLVPFPVAVFCL